MLTDTVKNHIETSPNNGAGYECNFWLIGVKVWRNKEKAEDYHSVQAQLSLLGLAPKVLGEVFEVFPYRWGFQTEVAIALYKLFKPSDSERFSVWRDEFMDTDVGKKYATAMKAVRDAGWIDIDPHFNNYGVLPSGDVVVIDTGDIAYDKDFDKSLDTYESHPSSETSS